MTQLSMRYPTLLDLAEASAGASLGPSTGDDSAPTFGQIGPCVGDDFNLSFGPSVGDDTFQGSNLGPSVGDDAQTLNLGPSVGDDGVPATPSDLRLKTDIHEVGTTAHGLPLYHFRYVGGPGRYEGVMAQDVLKVMPEAVVRGPDGYYRVKYPMLGIEMRRV